jgi:hypothetical protein
MPLLTVLHQGYLVLFPEGPDQDADTYSQALSTSKQDAW